MVQPATDKTAKTTPPPNNKSKEQLEYAHKVAGEVNDLEECELMIALGRMGFTDFDRNLMLCRIYENNLDQCVAALNKWQSKLESNKQTEY